MVNSSYPKWWVWAVETVTIWTNGEWSHDLSFRTRERARQHAKDILRDYPSEVHKVRIRRRDPATI